MQHATGSIVKPVKDLMTFTPLAQRALMHEKSEKFPLMMKFNDREVMPADQHLLVISSSVETIPNSCSTIRFPPDGTDKEFLISNDLVFQVLSPEEFILRKD